MRYGCCAGKKMKIDNFFAELKRRNVYKVAVAYVVAWLLIQAASILFPTFEAPAWVMKVFVSAVILGFPLALVLAWAFDITPEGIKRESEVKPNESITSHTQRKLVGVTVALAAVAAALLAYQLLRPKSQNSAVTTPTAAAIPQKSIAVLPFENLSDDKQNAYFTDGVQDEILTDLAKIADLKVISRTSVMQYKETAKRNLPEIAQALKVAHVLEGSVQRLANRVRVNAQLIDARTDAHLWAERYDRDLADVFAIQSEIAQKIADQLQAVLSPKEKAAIAAKPTNNIAAYDLYLRAKEIDQSLGTGAEETKQEVALLDDAVALDPTAVPAFCLLARAHLSLYWFNTDHTPARLELARNALDAAARLQPDAGEVHLTRAVFYYWGNRDYAPALAELALARRFLPNDSIVLEFRANVERRQGRWEESTHDREEALKLDPRNGSIVANLAGTYMTRKRYADAARVLDDGLRWKPHEFVFESMRAHVDRLRSADLRRLQSVLAGEYPKTADSDLAQNRLSLALIQRDFRAAEKALLDYKGKDFAAVSGSHRDHGFITPREVYEGVVAHGLGELGRAQSAFLAARERTAATVAKRPDDAKALIILAEIDARLGRKEEAVHEGEHAAELLPVAKDALEGPEIQTRLGALYGQVGQPDRALDLLERVTEMPGGPSYGELKLDLDWDPLRGDPRFEKIVASLAPKDPAGSK
jgi:TolB-like protein/Flp pilus assembly protein TadD